MHLDGYGYNLGMPGIDIPQLELIGISEEHMTVIRKQLLEVIPMTITVQWSPRGSENQLRATVGEIYSRIQTCRSGQPLKQIKLDEVAIKKNRPQPTGRV